MNSLIGRAFLMNADHSPVFGSFIKSLAGLCNNSNNNGAKIGCRDSPRAFQAMIPHFDLRALRLCFGFFGAAAMVVLAVLIFAAGDEADFVAVLAGLFACCGNDASGYFTRESQPLLLVRGVALILLAPNA
jgi:hypothetical protein